MIVDYSEQIQKFINSVEKDALSGELVLLENLKDHLARCVEILDLLEKDGSMSVECRTSITPKVILAMYSRLESSIVSKVKMNQPITEEEMFYADLAMQLIVIVVRDVTKAMLLEVLLGEPESIPKKASCH